MKLTGLILIGWAALLALNPLLHAVSSSGAQGPSAHGNVLFKIGSFDRSSAELANGTPDRPVDFVVGQSNPAKDWYATQLVTVTPSSAIKNQTDGLASTQAAPWVIHFSLGNAPAASYKLRVALLLESASVPVLHVSINGKDGKFYLYPVLDSNSGDQASASDCIYSHADVEVTFPGSYLHEGANTITLQATVEADKSVPEASLTYDAIEVDCVMGTLPLQASSIKVLPTIFYSQRGKELDEIVDVLIRSRSQRKPGDKVELMIAGKHYQQAILEDNDFGEEKLEFALPEFTSQTRVQVATTRNGRRKQTEEFINPQKKWTLFLVPHIHLDIGYTDYQAKVAAIQSRVIDEALNLIEQEPDFRFSLDGEWSLEQFLKTRTLADQLRVTAAIQKQQLFVPAQYANLLTGFATAETLIRSLYPSANFARQHGLPFNYANITDVPTYSWAYTSILAAAGVHQLIAASDVYRGPALLEGHLNERSPFWWIGLDGKKVLVWYSRHYQQMEFLFGLPPLLPVGRETLPLFLQQYAHPGYRANAAIIFGTQAENSDLFPQQAQLAKQWNRVYAYPHLRYSGFHHALENIAHQFGNNLPIVRGDGGPYWEDGIGSDAAYAAIERQNERRGLSVEKLATLTMLVNPLLAADKTDLDRMWTNMVLMDEHTWTSSNSVTDPTSNQAVQQLAVKDQYAVNAQALANSLAHNSMASLADSIATDPGSLVVFNTLNWKRSGLVSLDVDNWNSEIIDKSTGKLVPVDVVSAGTNFRHVLFLAQDIPAVGYKVFTLQDTKSAPVHKADESTTIVENLYYKVTLDPASGAVRSIYDKELRQELVDQQSPYRFGQYLYVTGGDRSPNTLLQYSPVYPRPDLLIHPSQHGHLVSVVRTAYGLVARMESSDTNTPSVRTEVRLFDNQKKIEFIEDVNKKEVNSKEAVYYAFPFAMDNPRFLYEIQNGVVDPATDMYPGAGQEWFSVQHWVSVEQNGMSATVMPLDASLVTLGDINRGLWPPNFGQRQGTIFSYVMNNYWNTNYRAGQGGNFHFRYVVTSTTSTDGAQLGRMGWEEITPLEHDVVTAQDKAAKVQHSLSGTQDSFLTVEDTHLLLEAWKSAEDGNGTILRFLDLGGEERTVTVQTPLFKLSQAWLTDAVERDQALLSLVGTQGFQFTIHPHEILTARITGKGLVHASNNRRAAAEAP